MRLPIPIFTLASLIVLPRAAFAQEGRPPPPPRPDASAEAPPAPPRPAPEVRPPPPPRPEYSPYPRTGPRPGRPYYYRPVEPPPRYRWGWGWGWGWYPLYPYQPLPPAQPSPDGRVAPPVPREEDRIYTRLSLYGAGHAGPDDGYMFGGSFGLEGRYLGFDADVAALARESVTGRIQDDESDPATWTTAHLTWSLVNERSARLRVETGLSVLDLPDSPAVFDRPWRGKTLLGPDVGLSGQIGLVGPLGIEGHARLTPFPTRVADTFIGLAVHGGPLGVSAGWRWVDVAGDGEDAPELMFRGPQVGLVLRF